MNLRAWAVALVTVFAASTASADPVFTTGLYAVGNYSGAFPDFKRVTGVSTPSYLDGVEGDLGWRFNRFYSMEASYSYYTASTRTNGVSFNTTLQTAALDALGYLPFGPGSHFALFADIGGTYNFLSGVTAVSKSSADRFGGRAGGGLQYQFDEDLGIRAGGRYEWANLPTMKSANVFYVGLVWQR